MRNIEVTAYQDVPIIKDKDGNIYSHADMNDQSIFEAIDSELKVRGLELLIGDYGSDDYFFCIVEESS